MAHRVCPMRHVCILGSLFHKSVIMDPFLFFSFNIILLLAGGCPNEGAFEQGQPESNLQFIPIG